MRRSAAASTSGTQAREPLVQVHAPLAEPRTAVVLIGGIHDTYNFLERWGERYHAAGLAVYGFDCDYRAHTMSEAAQRLEQGLHALAGRGVVRIVITAHSMGGLIAKHALDRLAASGGIGRFEGIELHALGTPWGGFRLADLVRYAPFPRTVGRLIGYPMGEEIGSGSAFMRGLGAALPANVALHIIEGSNDSVAIPSAPEELAGFAAVVRIATTHVVLPDVDHTGFRDPDVLIRTTANRDSWSG
jgi:hypothetical protein